MSGTTHLPTRRLRLALDTVIAGALGLTALTAGQPAPAAPRFPTAAQVNRAMARSDDFRGTSVGRMAGCFPLISEEGAQGPAGRSWYCAAQGAPLPAGAAFLEFAIRRAARSGNWVMVVGELGAACPSGAAIRQDGLRALTRRGVTGLFTDKGPFLGDLGLEPSGQAIVACPYLGRLGANHFQITLRFTFDGTGYHRVGAVTEEVFDINGNPVP